MKTYLALLSLLLTCTLGSAPAQDGIAPENQVKQVITDFADAWNRHDVPAMMALHTASINFTNIAGQWWKDREETTARLQHVHATVSARSTMTIHTDQVRFLSETVAVVHGTMELHNVPPPAQGECMSMRVLVKRNGKWLIDDFQNTLIRPPDAH